MSSTNPHQHHRSLSSSNHSRRLREEQGSQRPILNRTTISNEVQQPITHCFRGELETEDDLFKEIEELIHRFLTRPGRRYPYHTVIRWSNNPENVPDYSVMIKIDQPSRQNSM